MPKVQAATVKVRPEMTVLSEEQRKGRAINAVAEFLMRKLLVPKIYLKPIEFSVDVLAVDRAGSGDIHGVRIGPLSEPLLGSVARKIFEIRLENILTSPGFSGFHFKYIAVQPTFVDFLSKKKLFAENGIGRVGIIEIIESPSAPPEARIAIPAERFQVAPAEIKQMDAFQKKIPADIEIRD